MVKDFVPDAPAFSWQAIIAGLTVLGVVVGAVAFAISIQVQVQINASQLSNVGPLIRTIEARQNNGLAIQNEHERRLGVIEQHDVQTRDIEARVLERLSRVEGKLPQ